MKMVRLSGSKQHCRLGNIAFIQIDLSLFRRLVNLAGWGESLTYTF
jgi:hypothetical protein